MANPKWQLKRTTQCAKCPWRKDVDPTDIPNGYSCDKHRSLAGTIAPNNGSFGEALAAATSETIRIMGCHEENEAHCVGWLHNQLGEGNNLALRLHVMNCANIRDLKIIGEQHERFEDTLPQ